MTTPSQEYYSFVGRVIRDLAALRHAASDQFAVLPQPDPMRKVLGHIEDILADAEQEIEKAATGAGRFGPDPLGYIMGRMEELRTAIAREGAIEVEPTRRPLRTPLPPPRKRLR